jgi:hypothetical protein
MIRSYESLDREVGVDCYATFSFGVDGAVGNTEGVDTDFSGAFGYKGDTHWIRVYPAHRLKRSGGKNVIRDRSIHLRHSFIFSDRTRTFAFVQLHAAESLKLERRFLVAAVSGAG